LCVCYKVTIRNRIISVAEEPLWLSGSLSGGRRKRQLSHSHNGLALCDSLERTQQRDQAAVAMLLRRPSGHADLAWN